MASEYQRKIASIEPIADPEVQRMRLHLVEILCLSTVIDNYLKIVKYDIISNAPAEAMLFYSFAGPICPH